MTKDIETLIKERYDSLPKNLRQAIKSTGWENILRKISTTNNFTPEQERSLQTEVLLIFLGLDNPKFLIENLKKSLSLENELANSIAEDISELIFKEISFKLNEVSTSENKDAGLPMVEDGEVAHSVQPMSEGEKEEIIKKTEERMPTEVVFGAYVPRPNDNSNEREEKRPSTPLKNNYPGGVDPYREPLT